MRITDKQLRKAAGRLRRERRIRRMVKAGLYLLAFVAFTLAGFPLIPSPFHLQ